MSRSESPSLAINNIPPDVLQRFLQRSRTDGWVSKNALIIALMTDYADGRLTPSVTPPAVLPVSNTPAAQKAAALDLPIHGKLIRSQGQTWAVWVLNADDDAPHSTRVTLTLQLTAGGRPRSLALHTTKEALVVEHRQGDVEWVLDALRRWLNDPTPADQLFI